LLCYVFYWIWSITLYLVLFILKTPYFYGLIDSSNIFDNINFILNNHLNTTENLFLLTPNYPEHRNSDHLLTQSRFLSLVFKAEKINYTHKRFLTKTFIGYGKHYINQSISFWKDFLVNPDFKKKKAIIFKEHPIPCLLLGFKNDIYTISIRFIL